MDLNSLEEYVPLVVDATVGTGIMRQMDAFRSGFNQVIYFITHHLLLMSNMFLYLIKSELFLVHKLQIC